MSNSNFLDVSRTSREASDRATRDADAWEQKAIALVQKAIDEDVKQNYVVCPPSRNPVI